MNTIRELKQQEKYKNMLKRKNKEKNIYKTQNETLRIKYEGIKKLLEKKDKEIERLHSIINELEHHLYQEWLEWKDSDCESIYSRAGEDKAIYDYLQELKGDELNGIKK